MIARSKTPALPTVMDEIQDVLNKLYRAHKRGTGCRLTAREMDVLAVTQIGAWWGQPDPRGDGAEHED